MTSSGTGPISTMEPPPEWEPNASDSPPFCKRRRTETQSSAAPALPSRHDTACQTESVLLFACPRDLHRFLRLNSMLLGRCDRALQTDPNLTSRAAGVQTDEGGTKEDYVNAAVPPDPVFNLEDRYYLRAIHRQLSESLRRIGPTLEPKMRVTSTPTPSSSRPPPPSVDPEKPVLQSETPIADPDPVPISTSVQGYRSCPASAPTPITTTAPVIERRVEVADVKEEPDCYLIETKLASATSLGHLVPPWEETVVAHSSLMPGRPQGGWLLDGGPDSEGSNGPGSGPSSAIGQGRPRLRAHHLFCVPNHRVVEITNYNDVRQTAPDEEFRICPFVCESLLKKSCSMGNFGWRLVSTVYRADEMRERNYFGNRGKRPLSPRRLHAVEHAYYDYLPNEDPTLCLAEARNAINQGLRNITHNLTDFVPT